MNFNLACEILYGFGPRYRDCGFTRQRDIPEHVDSERKAEYLEYLRMTKPRKRLLFVDWLWDIEREERELYAFDSKNRREHGFY